MKKCVWILGIILWTGVSCSAQTHEVQQLLLNVEKLAQLKQMLSDLKKGYDILASGYNSIRNISEGNFNLHEAFLDGLLEVSPTVKKYRKVGEIVSLQLALVKDYKKAKAAFLGSGLFTAEELDYFAKVYSNLVASSLKNLESLVMIVTARQLRMSDDERLEGIDRIWSDLKDQTSFLRQFNNKNKILALQRAREQKDVRVLQKLYGLQP